MLFLNASEVAHFIVNKFNPCAVQRTGIYPVSVFSHACSFHYLYSCSAHIAGEKPYSRCQFLFSAHSTAILVQHLINKYITKANNDNVI